MITLLRRAGASLFNRPYLLLTLTSLLWAGNIVVGRAIAGEIPPFLLAFMRWVGAGLVVLPFAWDDLRRDFDTLRSRPVLMLLFSASGIAGYNLFAYWGLNHTQALNALLIQSTGPLLIAAWCFVLWRDALTLPQLVGILTSLGGVAVIVTHGDLLHLAGLEVNRGDLLTLIGLALYGLYAAMLRKRPPVANLSFLASTIILGAVLLAPVAAVEYAGGARMHVAPHTVAAVLYVAVFPSLIAYMFFVRGVELIGANRASPFFHLMPVFGSVIAILALGEEPRLFHAVGFGLVLAGVFVATRKRVSGRQPEDGSA
jgi:drug/metabolite transporter (DMT)-like permease